MRNPNGFGCPVKLSGNRRNPYGARKTIGFKDNGQPIYKFIGFYPTRKEAMIALGEYNSNPQNFVTVDKKLTPTNKITLQRVYNEWSEEHFQNISDNTSKQYKTAFNAISSIHDRPIESMTIKDYEDAFVKTGKSKIILNQSKIVLKAMYIYAYRKEYIKESALSIPQYISLANCQNKRTQQEHRSFTHNEIDTLWKHKDDDKVQIVLFMIYTGLRIEETTLLKKEDVHLSKRYFTVRKSKTEAGLRDVPINEKIVYIVDKWLKDDRELLVPLGKSANTRQRAHCNGFDKAIESAGLERHLLHDTRHTCTTLLTEAGVDERYVKLIVGHASSDVTNRVYAKKLDIKILIEAINKI